MCWHSVVCCALWETSNPVDTVMGHIRNLQNFFFWHESTRSTFSGLKMSKKTLFSQNLTLKPRLLWSFKIHYLNPTGIEVIIHLPASVLLQFKLLKVQWNVKIQKMQELFTVGFRSIGFVNKQQNVHWQIHAIR